MRYPAIVLSILAGAVTLLAAPASPQDEDVSTLIRQLRKPDKEIRISALRKLAKLGPTGSSAAPAVSKLVKGKDSVVRIYAVLALVRMGKDGMSRLEKDLRHPDPVIRRAVISGLDIHAGADPEDAVPILIRALKDRDAEVVMNTLSALGTHGAKAGSAIPVLTSMLKDDRHSAGAAGAVLRIVPETDLARRAVKRLIAILEGQAPGERYHAAYAFSLAGPEAREPVREALPVLLKLLRDPKSHIRHHAACALGHLGADAKAAVPDLMRMTGEGELAPRTSAIEALGKIGPAAAAAIPVLRKTAESSDSIVASLSRTALDRIDPDGTWRDLPAQAPKEPPPERRLPALLTRISEELTRDLTKRTRQCVILVLDDSMGEDLVTQVWPAWKGLLEAHPLRKDRRLYMGLVVLSEKSYVAVRPTNKLATVAAAIEKISRKKNNFYKNTMEAVRLAATLARIRQGNRAVVLYSQDNADGEDEIERTVAMLRAGRTRFYAVTPEAIYSDHYWKNYAYPGKKNAFFDPKTREPIELKFAIRGEESPFIEFPYRWLYTAIYSRSIADFGVWDGNSPLLVPSGFTFYAPARLARESGGKIFLCPPARPIPSFCIFVDCPLCAGAHDDCDATYDETKLKLTAPSLDARGDYVNRKNVDPLQAMALRVWWEASKIGVVSTKPPVRITPDNRLTPQEGPASDEAVYFSAPWFVADKVANVKWQKLAADAKKKAAATDELLKRMEGELGGVDRLAADKRWLATVEALQACLAVSRMNLLLWGEFCIKQDMKKFEDGILSVESHPRYSFCHGGKALRDAEKLTDDPGIAGAWRALSATVDEIIDRHRGTPWALIVRRTMILGWQVRIRRPSPPSGGNTVRSRRAKTGSEDKRTQTPPTRAGRSSRGSSSSRSGATGGNR